MKKAFLIHGWEGNPENNWFPWLKKELENIGYEVIVPKMPTPETPVIETWVGKLKKIVEPEEENILIGHSIGCQTILRYLQELDNKKFAGIYLIAGFVKLKNLENEEVEKIAEPWVITPLNWDKIKKCCEKFVAIFSDDDPFVDLNNSEIFKEKLGAKIIIEHDKGHFDDEANVKELPVLLDEIKR